jgi:hypothetical protein
MKGGIYPGIGGGRDCPNQDFQDSLDYQDFPLATLPNDGMDVIPAKAGIQWVGIPLEGKVTDSSFPRKRESRRGHSIGRGGAWMPANGLRA